MEEKVNLIVGILYIKQNLKKTRPISKFNDSVFVVIDEGEYAQRLYYASGRPHYSNPEAFPIIAEFSEDTLSSLVEEREKLIIRDKLSEDEIDKRYADWLERRKFYRDYGFAH